MKYIVQIAGQKVLLDETRMSELVNTLVGAEKLDEVYIGSGKGDDGSNYSKQIRPFEMETQLSVNVIPDTYYDAIVLKTKLMKDVK